MAFTYNSKLFGGIGTGGGSGGVGTSSSGQVLLNIGGAVNGDPGLTYDAATDTLSVVDLAFTGTSTTGLHLKTLTTAQRDAVSPAASAGDTIYNSTTARVEVFDGALWHARVRLDGDTMTGPLNVPGVTARQLATTTTASTPTIASVTPVGTPGAVTYGYRVMAFFPEGTFTAASAEVTTTTGNATLDGTNYNTIAWGAFAGSSYYKLYRTTGTPGGGSAPPRLLYTGPLLTFNDTNAASTAETYKAYTNTGQVLALGSVGYPGFAFAGADGFGITKSGNAILFTNSASGSPSYIAAVGYANYTVSVGGSGGYAWAASSNNPVSTLDTFLSRGSAPANVQLGAAASATPVAQTLQAQGGSGTDIAGAAQFSISASRGTGAGSPGSIALQTGVRGTTGTTAQTASTRFFVSGNDKTLTLGSNTNFVRIDFPASSTISVGIEYNVNVYDTASPPEFKAHGGRYGFSAYRKSTGNAVAGTVVETLESGVQSVGNAMTDSFTVTGDANGVLVGTNVSVGTGLTGTPVGTVRYQVTVNGSGAATVTPQ